MKGLRLTPLIVALSFSVRVAVAADPINLVANGDFSQVSNSQPDKWALSGNPTDVDQRLEVGKDADGKTYAKLICTRCEYRSANSHAMITQVGVVNLAKDKIYEFSCRMRAEGLRGRVVGVAIQETPRAGYRRALTPNW